MLRLGWEGRSSIHLQARTSVSSGRFARTETIRVMLACGTFRNSGPWMTTLSSCHAGGLQPEPACTAPLLFLLFACAFCCVATCFGVEPHGQNSYITKPSSPLRETLHNPYKPLHALFRLVAGNPGRVRETQPWPWPIKQQKASSP